MNATSGVRLLAACLAAGLHVAACLSARAAMLSTVPMQGMMAMPEIAYSSVEGRLHVSMPAAVPQLTPLLVSNPADTFDPADPWYDKLDPYRQGLAFSRRYGFVMATETDPLPPDRAIWIRKLSGPPELEVYRYSGNLPKEFTPIFGTAGSSNALYWNGTMFHPCFAAPPGTNNWTAIFEAYLVDTVTMEVLPATSTGTMVFNFTDVPDGRPTLNIGMLFALSWPADATSHVLEAASSLNATNWSVVTNKPVMLEGRPAVLLPRDDGRYYRMRPAP